MKPIRTLGLATLALALGVAFAAPAEARDDHRRGYDRGHSSQDWRRDQDRRSDYRRDDRRYDDRRHVRYDRRDDRDYDRYDRRDDRRHDRKYDKKYDKKYARYDRRDTRVVYAPRQVVVHHPGAYRGPPPWSRGRHYRHTGYAPTYVVHDYGHYGLRHPPRGHHWRRSDASDFLMVAIATGIIADVILGR